MSCGPTATSYAPYFEPIELAKISTYKDKIYKDSGKWYLHKEIGKIMLNGTETITTRSNTSVTHSKYVLANILPTDNAGHLYIKCSHFTVGNANDGAISIDCVCSNNTTGYKKYLYFSIETSLASTTTEFGNWLSINKPTIYYALATSTDTEITNEALIEQLEAVKLLSGTQNNFTIDADILPTLNLNYIGEAIPHL